MGYVVALLWVCGVAAAGLALFYVWLVTHPDEHEDIESNEHHRTLAALEHGHRPGGAR